MLRRTLHRTLFASAVCFLWAGVHLIGSFHELAAAEKRSLWKIQSKGNVVYLLGSIHYLKPQNYPLDPAIEAAFKDARKLVLEINLESMEKEQGQKLMFLKGVYTDGRTLQEGVSAATYTLAERELKGLGLDIRALHQLKPWLVALTVTALKLQKLGFDPNYGIDKYFYSKAKKENKEVLALETLEFQMNLFDGMSEKTQELMLLQTLKDAHSIGESIDRIVKAWASGDMGTLDSVMLQSLREYPEVYQRLIVERNRAWLPQIESYLTQNENSLVVVGTAHLAGKDGVVELLKAKGYSVEQQ
ncbi:MAG: TraB/GumN family protein [Candidatus Binatia bacterium]